MDGEQSSSQKKRARARFTPEEDYVIRSMYQGVRTNWGFIAKILNRDNEKMIYDRYHAYLAPGINSTPFTDEEFEILKYLVQVTGTNWKFIRKFFPGRTIYNLKNNFHILCNRGKLDYKECMSKPHIEDEKIINQELIKLKNRDMKHNEPCHKKIPVKKYVITPQP